MNFPDMHQYITLLFLLLDAFAAARATDTRRGRPPRYPAAALLVFYAAMPLKGITAIGAQRQWLFHHPLMLKVFRLPACPSHVTLSRHEVSSLC